MTDGKVEAPPLDSTKLASLHKAPQSPTSLCSASVYNPVVTDRPLILHLLYLGATPMAVISDRARDFGPNYDIVENSD